MKLFDKILNSTLILILAGSLSWFAIFEHDKFNVPVYEVPEEVVEKPESIDWAPLIPGASSIAVFLARYFLIERKKKKAKLKLPLTDHLIFDTIEDMIENELKHRNFGSEGRTEAMRTLISIQLETYGEFLKEFILINTKFDSSADFRKKLRSCIFDMVNKTEKRWQERQLPQKLIDKYSALYKQRIELLLSDVLVASTISNVENNEALETFLNDARIIIRTGLQEDVMVALRALNGELSGLTFNGKKL